MTDPRSLRGSIAGPGGPRDRNAVVIDATHAVLLDNVEVCVAHPRRDGVPQDACLTMMLSGRINRTADRADLLFMFDVDGAAAIITELLALGSRMDSDELTDAVTRRMHQLAEDDAIGGQ